MTDHPQTPDPTAPGPSWGELFDEAARVGPPPQTPVITKRREPPHPDWIRAGIAIVLVAGSCILLILVVIAWMIGLPKGSTVEAILPAVGLLTTLTAGVTAYYFGKER